MIKILALGMDDSGSNQIITHTLIDRLSGENHSYVISSRGLDVKAIDNFKKAKVYSSEFERILDFAIDRINTYLGFRGDEIDPDLKQRVLQGNPESLGYITNRLDRLSVFDRGFSGMYLRNNMHVKRKHFTVNSDLIGFHQQYDPKEDQADIVVTMNSDIANRVRHIDSDCSIFVVSESSPKITHGYGLSHAAYMKNANLIAQATEIIADLIKIYQK